MKFFLEPIAVSLNYLQTRAAADQFPVYRDFSMIGLSGGGWTTVVYAAIDPRIKLSVPTAGSLPLYLRFPASEGDTEQNLAPFYSIAGYPDLHVMGSYGLDRQQVQVLNRHDDCCFGEQFHDATRTGMSFDQAVRSYEWRVRATLATLDSGSFRIEMDEAAPAHMISWSNITSVLLAQLDGDRTPVAVASPSDAFVRGANGDLWHHGAAGWEDTHLPTVGAPAVVGGDSDPVSVFYRDTTNHLMRAFINANIWTASPLGGTVVITDPVAASTGAGQYDVVALGPDYTPYHWWSNGGDVASEHVSTTRGLGQPALLDAPGRLDIFVRGFDRALYHVRKTSTGVTSELIGNAMSGFPTAVATSSGVMTTRRVFVRGSDDVIWQATSLDDAPWTWTRIAPAGMTDIFSGSPTASTTADGVIVHARTRSGALGALRWKDSTGWSYSNDGGIIADSPSSLGAAAYARLCNGMLVFYDRTQWQSLGGHFD
jgi:hypothetical protein